VVQAQELRNVLSRMFKARNEFQLGEMSDAVEAMDCILDRLHEALVSNKEPEGALLGEGGASDAIECKSDEADGDEAKDEACGKCKSDDACSKGKGDANGERANEANDGAGDGASGESADSTAQKDADAAAAEAAEAALGPDKTCVDKTFGLTLKEQAVCPVCDSATQALEYRTFVSYVSVSAICAMTNANGTCQMHFDEMVSESVRE
jgi:hypothetical protein